MYHSSTRRQSKITGHRTIAIATIVGLSCGLFWLVSLYEGALRDARQLDGWVLVAAMLGQFAFRLGLKSKRMTPATIKKWRSAHILTGYFVTSAFVSHANNSIPDTGFEWALWLCFTAVILSGVFSTQLTLASNAIGPGMNNIARIRTRCSDLENEVQKIATIRIIVPVAGLPPPPDSQWLADLYDHQLATYFAGHPALQGKRKATTAIAEIDELTHYATTETQGKLHIIKRLVEERRQLSIQARRRIVLGICKGLHLHGSYALFALAIIHVLAVYSFSSSTG